MSAREFEEAAARLRGDAATPEYWRRMGRLVWRYHHLPGGLQRHRHLALLAPLLRDPDEALWALPLFLHMVKLQLGEQPQAPGRVWEDHARAATRGPVPVDAATGLPLRLRRPVDGAEMALVPATTVAMRDHGTRDVEDVYVDLVRRAGPDFDGYREATGGETPGKLSWGDTNGFQPRATVEGYARWVGARPVTYEEVAVYTAGVRFTPPPMPDHDDDLRAAAKARWRARQAEAAASTPYGIQDLPGSDWCLYPEPGGGRRLGAVHLSDRGEPPGPWNFGENHPLRLAVPALVYPPGWPDDPGGEAPLDSVFPHGVPAAPG